MIILLSPAKTLNETRPDLAVDTFTEPAFWEQSKELAEIMKQRSSTEIQSLMKVSQKIGDLNFERYQNFPDKLTLENAYPALHCFQGDVYQGIDEQGFLETEWAFAQKNLRILSGLYGLLRPLDLMYPYRLEMGTALENTRGKNLYEWWGSRVTDQINADLSDGIVVNLASQEYFDVIQPEKISGKILNIHFKENKNGDYKVIGIHAKRARGVMTNWIIKNQWSGIEKLKNFSENLYQFRPEMSDDLNWVFAR